MWCAWVLLAYALLLGYSSSQSLNVTRLAQFVDELQSIPNVTAYQVDSKHGGLLSSKNLTIGMYKIKWKFHRDLPETTVYAFGASARTASIPGPTIEARHAVPTNILWDNQLLDKKHILPTDKTITIAQSNDSGTGGGIPTVVHLHGSITEPTSDGNSYAWFTARFEQRGPKWSQKDYHYPNAQGPATLWYHDHAMGLTRINILAGLSGAYVIRNPDVEDVLNLPKGTEFDRVLVISDRDFNRDGSIYMDPVGNNPGIHPQWQPEYFGSVVIVNGKAWPYLRVNRQKYRFRIINSSNARFYALSLSNGLSFTQIGSDASYLPKPVRKISILIAPSEIQDVLIDFSNVSAAEREIILKNTAPYPYPSGDPTNLSNGQVMKFIVSCKNITSTESKIPKSLVPIQRLRMEDVVKVRYINLYEYESSTGEPTRLLINGMTFDEPVSETPKAGTTELWHVINLTEDNHPLHVHLSGFQVVGEHKLRRVEELRMCLVTNNNSLHSCKLSKFMEGRIERPPLSESGWKNVYKTKPGHVTSLLIRFTMFKGEAYPFNVSAEPGYAYHCHILDHEDNEMMRPFKILP